MRLSFEWAIMQGMKATLNIAGERVTVTAFGDGASAAFDGMNSVVCDDMKLAALDGKHFALSRSGVSLSSGDESHAFLAHEPRMSFGADSLATGIIESRVPPYGGRRAAFDDANLVLEAAESRVPSDGGHHAPFSGSSVGHDAVESHVPFVYMHEIQDESDAMLKRCAELGCPPFVLVAIHVSEWNDMLTPWECPGIFADDAPFAGHAEHQLEILSEIVQKTEEQLGARPSHRCIAGYSLAGLFATWAPFQTDLFDAVASASGSMWYPDFAEYVEAGTFDRSPRCAYFSLGSKEARTPSRLLRGVADGTQRVVDAFRTKGVKTVFESNPGNHFKEPDLRMAKAICWAVSNCGEGAASKSRECELRRE